MREITSGNSSFAPTPVLNFRSAPGSTFKGRRIAEPRTVKKFTIYEFAALDGNMPTQIKNDDGTYKDVEVKEGETVALFVTSVLVKMLAQTKVGDIVEITYGGLQPTKAGNKFHAFKVSVED